MLCVKTFRTDWICSLESIMLEALECASCIVIFSKSHLVMPSIRLAYACLLKQDLISLVQSLLVGQMCEKEVDFNLP